MSDGNGAYIDQITTLHMEMKIDIDSLVKQHREGNEQLLAIYLIQRFYQEFIKKLGDDVNQTYKRRALDHAKFLAIQRLPELKSETEASFYYLLDEAERTGWFHADHLGYNTLEEMLADMIDPETMGVGEVSNWKFVVKEMLPMARRLDIPPDQMLAASLQVKKLRESVSTCRRIFKEVEMGDKDPDEGANEFRAIIEWIADPKVTWTQFETNLGKREPPDVYRAITVYEVSMPGGAKDGLGDTWLVIPLNTETDKRILERQLNHRMNKKTRILPWLLEEIQKYIPIGVKDA